MIVIRVDPEGSRDMKLRWDKLLEFTRAEVKDDSRETVRLKRRYDSGEADVEEILDLAKHLIYKKEHRNSERLLNELLNHPDIEESALFDVCSLFERAGNYDAAYIGYQRFSELSDQDAMPLYRMGRLLEMQGKLDEAIELHYRALSLEPENPECYYRLGVAFTKSRRFWDISLIWEGSEAQHFSSFVKLCSITRRVRRLTLISVLCMGKKVIENLRSRSSA